MIVIPAIDLKDGKCVRLMQGDFNRVTVYSDNPVEMAQHWEAQGAGRLHIVDLDGSLAGEPRNREAVRDILKVLKIPVEIGGGIRDKKSIATYLDMGVKWVIIGTAAVKDKTFLKQACQDFPGHVILGIDADDGRVAVEGWTEKTTVSAVSLAREYETYGVDAVIYTDIKRDGMQAGVNVDKTKELAQAISIPLIASGGVKDVADIDSLLAVEKFGVCGVIVGKALYAGTLSLKAAVAHAERPH